MLCWYRRRRLWRCEYAIGESHRYHKKGLVYDYPDQTPHLHSLHRLRHLLDSFLSAEDIDGVGSSSPAEEIRAGLPTALGWVERGGDEVSNVASFSRLRRFLRQELVWYFSE